MPRLKKSQARARRPLAHKAPLGLVLLGGPQPHHLSQPHCSDRAFGCRPSTLAVGNERPLAVRSCRADCLANPSPIRKNQFL